MVTATETASSRKDRDYLVREHRTGRFSRSMRLPAMYDADACQARFEDGILRLTFPKSEAAKPRRIQIGGSRQSAVTNGKSKG